MKTLLVFTTLALCLAALVSSQEASGELQRNIHVSKEANNYSFPPKYLDRSPCTCARWVCPKGQTC